jgi:hypothetical protein
MRRCVTAMSSTAVGHSRSVLSAPPEAIRVPSGLNATLYTSGYVECAYGGFGEGCRKRYDFVPYMDLPDGWFTKDGNSYCSRPCPRPHRRFACFPRFCVHYYSLMCSSD